MKLRPLLLENDLQRISELVNKHFVGKVERETYGIYSIEYILTEFFLAHGKLLGNGYVKGSFDYNGERSSIEESPTSILRMIKQHVSKSTENRIRELFGIDKEITVFIIHNVVSPDADLTILD